MADPDPSVDLAAAVAAVTLAVPTQHNDLGRTGANLNEGQLTTATVNPASFGKLFTRVVDGHIYAQPLYVAGVSIPGLGTHNVVYVATMHNSVYAFDADDADASVPLWHVNCGPSLPIPPDWPSGDYKHSNFQVEIGIVSTPTIDVATQTLYVVPLVVANGGQRHQLHALDLTTGSEKFGGPVAIAAQVSGTGAGSSGGVIAFESANQNQRSSLLLANGRIYIAFASYADVDVYHGWVLAYDASTLQQVAVLNVTPAASEGGIWQSGNGPAADSAGHLYIMTGNSDNTQAPGPDGDLGCSIVKLDPDLNVVDWFTPYNVAELNALDWDLGSAGPLLVPGTSRLVGGGKEGRLYVLETSGPASMGQFDPAGDHVVQSFQASERSDPLMKVLAPHFNIHGSPVYWQGPGAALIYIWAEEDRLKAFRWEGNAFVTTAAGTIAPAAASAMKAPPGMPGGIVALSANGNQAGSGVVWASHAYQGDATQHVVPGILHAFDAEDVSRELWNSRQNLRRDDVGAFAKFCPPTVAAGKVYLATFSGQLLVYGLLTGPLRVSYAAGWQLIGGPTDASFAAPRPYYTLQAGDVAYETVSAGTALQPGLGYWAWFPTAGTGLLPRDPAGAQPVVRTLPAGRYVLIGNPFSSTAAVSGADVVYTYDPASGYTAATQLPPGQGAWAFAAAGGPVTISPS